MKTGGRLPVTSVLSATFECKCSLEGEKALSLYVTLIYSVIYTVCSKKT